MKLYFARHGQTDANSKMRQGEFIAELDEPLNQIGIEQAEQLAVKLADVKFDQIISSPMHRAVQTAEIVNQQHGLDIIVDDAWRERDAGAYIDSDTWNDMFDFDKNIAVKDGESLHAFFDRVHKAIEKLKSLYGLDSTLLVVSHGGVQHVLYAYANKLALKGNMRISPMRNCEFKIFEL